MCSVADRYQLAPGRELVIAPGAMVTLLRHRHLPGTSESGGILLGRVVPNERVVVEVASEPNTRDRAGTTSFERDAVAAQRIVDAAWHTSGGERIYLGEWHSHSEADPRPSRRDRTMIRTMFRGTQMEIPFLLLIIVGLETLWVGVENGTSLRNARAVSA